MAVKELEERSIVSEMVVHGTDQEVVVVSMHGLMHEVLGQRTRKKNLNLETRAGIIKNI